MLVKLTLLVGGVLIFSYSIAQHSIYLGVKGGYHASTAILVNAFSLNAIPASNLYGASGGLIAKYFPKAHFGVQGEVLLVRKGYDQQLTDTREIFRTTFDYLEIPFLFSIYLGKRKMQYFLNFGPYWSSLIKHQLNGPAGSGSKQLDFLYDANRDNRSSLGIKLGAGIFREFSFGGLQIDGFMTVDISDFLNPVDLSTGIPNNSKNLVFGATVAYLIPLGKALDWKND